MSHINQVKWVVLILTEEKTKAWEVSVISLVRAMWRQPSGPIFCHKLCSAFHFPMPTDIWASLVAKLVKNPPAMQDTPARSLGWEDPLEKEKATHTSIVACRIPWTL